MREPATATTATTATEPPAITTAGLTKRYGRHRAVNNIDLTVPRGSVFGFLGPNGSGKTTTIRMLLGLASPSRGSARVLGQEAPGQLAGVLPRVGALIEGPAFYPFLSGRANLRRLDSANLRSDPKTRRARVARALDRVGLTSAAGKKVRAYSLGMKQRLGIAAALVSPRELLVLDEPTNGLDPQGTREVRALIRSLAEEGTTVFISSHLLAEIEQICSHVAVMHEGILRAQGTLAELRASASARLHVHTPDPDLATIELSRFELEVSGRHLAGDGATELRAVVTGTDDRVLAEPEQIAAALVAAGVRLRGFEVASSSLEELFVGLTGEGLDVAQ